MKVLFTVILCSAVAAGANRPGSQADSQSGVARFEFEADPYHASPYGAVCLAIRPEFRRLFAPKGRNQLPCSILPPREIGGHNRLEALPSPAFAIGCRRW